MVKSNPVEGGRDRPGMTAVLLQADPELLQIVLFRKTVPGPNQLLEVGGKAQGALTAVSEHVWISPLPSFPFAFEKSFSHTTRSLVQYPRG